MIKSLAILATIGLVSGATDYCASNLCSNGPHIGCHNSGGFGSACPAARTMVEMTTALKNAILKSHNTKRNTIASGKLPGFKAANRMATMKWNDELAKIAAFNVKRCVYGHDNCRNTVQFKYSGQNLAKKWWSGGNPTDLSSILDFIDAWWSEYKDTTMANINSYPSNPSKEIGHFTVMTADKNIAVGCAAIKFRDSGMNNWNSLTMACNYATTNIVGRPLYVAGTTAAKCTTGKNPNFPALCSISEKYDVNQV